jgi:hypothetical protein
VLDCKFVGNGSVLGIGTGPTPVESDEGREEITFDAIKEGFDGSLGRVVGIGPVKDLV